MREGACSDDLLGVINPALRATSSPLLLHTRDSSILKSDTAFTYIPFSPQHNTATPLVRYLVSLCCHAHVTYVPRSKIIGYYFYSDCRVCGACPKVPDQPFPVPHTRRPVAYPSPCS
jgi:hypothetical protein